MASSHKELEQQLVEAGNKLLQPISSVDDELLLLLDVSPFSSFIVFFSRFNSNWLILVIVVKSELHIYLYWSHLKLPRGYQCECWELFPTFNLYMAFTSAFEFCGLAGKPNGSV